MIAPPPRFEVPGGRVSGVYPTPMDNLPRRFSTRVYPTPSRNDMGVGRDQAQYILYPPVNKLIDACENIISRNYCCGDKNVT